MRKDRLGKYLSYILRHEPEHIDMKLDENGWLNLKEMIAGINRVEKFKITEDNVKNEVIEDEKGRFEISKDGNFIRCLQGHKKGLTNIEFEEVSNIEDIPKNLIHGTKLSIKSLLLEEGIKKGKRDYVHLTEDEVIAKGNGERWKEKNAFLINIDARQMKKDGFKFFKSKNNVWLVESVPSKYFTSTKVIENKNKVNFRKNI